MSNDSAGWDVDALGRQVGPRKGELMDLNSRLDWSERFVSQHERDIKQTRYEAASISAHLEKRIEGLERLIVFLGDVLIALVAALFAGLVAAYVQGDIYWLAGSGLFVFVTTLLAANFFFRKVVASCLKTKSSRSLRPAE
jgi:hypothetical protein